MSTAKLQPTVAVDFDGTLCDHEYPNIGKIKPGAREALVLLRQMGFKIIIWTCRTCHWNYDVFGGDPGQPTLERKHVVEMVDFLNANQIPYDIIDNGSRGKPLADYYIDDKAIRFENNWPQIVQAIAINTAITNAQKAAQAELAGLVTQAVKQGE